MRPRLRTITAILLLGLLGLLLLAAGLYGLRETLIGPRLLSAANSYLAPALGVELRAAAIGGNYFKALVLHDPYTVAVTPADGTPPAPGPHRLALQARQLRLSYHLPALRHGPSAFFATMHLELDHGNLELTMLADRPTTVPPAGHQLDPAAIRQFLQDGMELATAGPALTINQLDLRLTAGETTLRATDLDLAFTPATSAGNPTRLLLTSPAGGLQHPRLQSQQAPIELALQARTTDHRGGLLAIDRLHWGERLQLHAGHLTWSDQEAAPLVALDLALTALGTDLQGRVTMAPEHLRGEVATAFFDLTHLASVLRQPPPLAGEIRTSGHLTLVPGDPWNTMAGALTLRLRRGEVAEHYLDDLKLQVGLEHGQLHLPRLSARLGDNHLALRQLSLPLESLYRADLPTILAQGQLAGLEVDFANLPALPAAAGWAPNTTAAALFTGLAGHRLQLQASLADGRFALSNVNLEGDGVALQLPRADLGPWPATDSLWQLPLTGQLQLTLDDLGRFTDHWQLPTLDGRLTANLHLRGTPARPQGELQLAATQLSQRDFTLERLQMAIQGEGEGPGLWPRLRATVQIDHLRPTLTADGPQPPLELQSIATAFRLDDQQLTVEHFTIRHDDDRLRAGGRLQLPSGIRPDRPAATAGELMKLLKQAALQDLQAELEVAALAAYLPLLPPRLLAALPAGAAGEADGALTVRLTGDGTLAQPTFLAEVELERARLADFRLGHGRGRISFRLPAMDPARLQLEGQFQAHKLQKDQRLIDKLAAELHLSDGRLTVTRGEASGAGSRLQLAGELTGLGSDVLELRLDHLELHGTGLELTLVPPGRLRLIENRLQDADFVMRGHGAAISLQGGYNPHRAGDQLDLQARLHSDDPGWLAPLLPGVRRLAGKVVVELDVGGTPADPVVNGTLRLRDGELHPTGDPPALREIKAEARFHRRGVELVTLEGRWGGAPFNLNGRLELPLAFPLVDDRELARELLVDLELRGDELLFYRAEGILMRGRAALRLHGPLSALHLSGDVAISDGRYTRNVDFLEMFRAPRGAPRTGGGMKLFSLTTPPWRTMTFDVHLGADQPFTVANNMARGSLRPEMRLRGSGELPLFSGQIYLDPTRITMPSGRFQIESGLIRFPEQDPDRPEFDLLATARRLGYDISVILQGTAAEPVLTLSSTPPLPDDELLLLVLTGQPPASMGEASRRRAGINMILFLGRDLLARLFHGDEPPSDEALLERFHLEVGRDITRAGDETIEAELRLVDDLVRPGDRLFITGEKDVYDDFNIGLKMVFRFR